MGRGCPDKHMITEDTFFLPCLHSVAAPGSNSAWPSNIDESCVAHFMNGDDMHIRSFGSGYGANSILSWSCFGLRTASVLAHREGWLAARCMILSVTSPKGIRKYFCAVMPAGCGKSNLAMLVPKIPGWKMRCISDDVAWIHPDESGVVRAINPHYGFFDVATGCFQRTQPPCLTCSCRSIRGERSQYHGYYSFKHNLLECCLG